MPTTQKRRTSKPAKAEKVKPAARRGRTSPAPKAKSARPTPSSGSSARTAAAKVAAAKVAAAKVARPAPAAKPTATPNRGKYVYCIIRAAQPLKFGPIGIGTEPADVHIVSYKEIAAVVSDTPVEVFDATRENVLAHERVNETVMRGHTVIPMSFGTVFKTEGDIIELLKAAYEAFVDVLNKMDGKLEFGLKVLWDRDAVIREIEAEDDDVARLKDEISSQKGSTYFARMQYGRLVDAAVETRTERYVAEIFEKLRPVSVASRANKPIGDKMIMNAAFLVAREKEQEFDNKVKEIGARYENLTFKYTGPWPPYNFVNIRLKLERAKEAP